jgi:hypothetical protein
MTIDVHHPELEALIQVWMRTGRFSSVEEALIDALKSAPSARQESSQKARSGRTGSALVAAMQASPFREIEIEPARIPMPMRDLAL